MTNLPPRRFNNFIRKKFRLVRLTFIAQAKKDGAKPAIRTLLYAQKAEVEHARLYQDAFDNLGQNADLTIYVCNVCGYTVNKLPRISE